jgi:hypothetical protein
MDSSAPHNFWINCSVSTKCPMNTMSWEKTFSFLPFYFFSLVQPIWRHEFSDAVRHYDARTFIPSLMKMHHLAHTFLYGISIHIRTHNLTNITIKNTFQVGSRGSVVGWGTMLQAGRSRFRVPMRWIFSINQILPTALWPYGHVVDSVSNRNESGIFLGVKGLLARKADKLFFCGVGLSP